MQETVSSPAPDTHRRAGCGGSRSGCELSGNPYSLPKFVPSTAFWGRFPKLETSTEEQHSRKHEDRARPLAQSMNYWIWAFSIGRSEVSIRSNRQTGEVFPTKLMTVWLVRQFVGVVLRFEQDGELGACKLDLAMHYGLRQI
jgi:hypothetical protein